MKRQDFKPCLFCGKGVAHTGLPLFWRVTIERMGIDGNAVRRFVGMETFFGPAGAPLADVFSDGAPLASPIDTRTGVTPWQLKTCTSATTARVKRSWLKRESIASFQRQQRTV